MLFSTTPSPQLVVPFSVFGDTIYVVEMLMPVFIFLPVLVFVLSSEECAINEGAEFGLPTCCTVW